MFNVIGSLGPPNFLESFTNSSVFALVRRFCRPLKTRYALRYRNE